MMNEDEQLRRAVSCQKQRCQDEPVRLGNVTRELMENHISVRQTRFGSIPRVWSQLLPEELHRHCKIDDISGGRLKVLVDLPAYMYELQLCSSQLIAELQQQCPNAKIKKIKFVVGPKIPD